MDIPQKFRDLKRFNQVVSVLLKHEVGFVFESVEFWKKKQTKLSEPRVLREMLEELGGTFTKLGQLLSLRPDLIPNRYCDELTKLQDSVKEFPYQDAKKIIENDLGKKMNDVFESFGKETIASASVGQVYKAKLKDGPWVAVKVQRPGIRKLMETDIEIMEFLAKRLKGMTHLFNAEEIVEEFKDYTENELDFMTEVSNIEKFYETFKYTSLRIPKPYKERCSNRIVVMEFVEGVELKTFIAKSKDMPLRKELSDELVNAFYKQVFLDGVFHADPHPGNMLVLDRDTYPGQKLALLDFGIVGEINTEMRKSLLRMFMGLINRDLEGIVSAMVTLHLVDSDSKELRRDMREMLGPYYGASINKIDVPKLFLQSIKVAKRHNVKMNKDFVLLGKAVITLESVCLVLYPEFNFVESSKPFLARIMVEKHKPRQVIRAGLDKAHAAERFIAELPSRVNQYFENEKLQSEYIKDLSEHMHSLSRKIDYASERFFLFAVAVVLLASGFFMLGYGPHYSGLSALSVLLFLFALASIFLMFTTFKKS